jgi:hypothetical protein
MKSRVLKIVWGVISFSLVVLSLACIQGYVTFDCFIGWKSFTIFTCLGILSFISYLLSGGKKWGWLFPALIFAALGLNSVGVFEAFGSPIVAFPLLLALALTFYIGYLIDRKQWGWLIPAWILTVLALIPPLVSLVAEDLLIALILYSFSLPFMVGSISYPDRRWPLFIAAFFGFAGVFILVGAFIHGTSPIPLLLAGISLALITLLVIAVELVAATILKMRVTRQLSS